MSGQPPHDLDAERAVLGALLSGADLAGAGPLASMDFYRPAHALIFEAVCALDSGGRPRDPVAVGDELRQRARWSPDGRRAVPDHLHASVPGAR